MLLMTARAPVAPPVTLAEAKAHLRVTHDAEDSLIVDLIRAAGDFISEDAGLSPTNRVFRLSLSDRPATAVDLPRHPVTRIVSVTVYNRDGTPQALDGDRYALDLLRRPATLTLDDDALPREVNGVEIEFEAGFGIVGSDVPEALRRAILALIARWYELRGAYAPSDQPVSVPHMYARLVRPWRRIGV